METLCLLMVVRCAAAAAQLDLLPGQAVPGFLHEAQQAYKNACAWACSCNSTIATTATTATTTSSSSSSSSSSSVNNVEVPKPSSLHHLLEYQQTCISSYKSTWVKHHSLNILQHTQLQLLHPQQGYPVLPMTDPLQLASPHFLSNHHPVPPPPAAAIPPLATSGSSSSSLPGMA